MSNESVETSTELVPTTGLGDMIANLASGNSSVRHTFQGNDWETKLAVLSAVNNATPLESVAGTEQKPGGTIMLANYVLQPIELVNEKTGMLEEAPRIMLVDADGTAYSCVSGGIFRSLENIAGILGQPHTWPAPLPIKVTKMKAKGAGHFFTINPVKQ